jgi:hypothetical protein
MNYQWREKYKLFIISPITFMDSNLSEKQFSLLYIILVLSVIHCYNLKHLTEIIICF